MNHTQRIALLAGLALLAGAGCSRSHTVSTSDGKVTVEQKGQDSGRVTVTDKSGQKATLDYNAGKIPDDYPKDVPVYRDAKILMSQTVSEKSGRSLMLESGDGLEKIAAYYKKELDNNGWKTEGTVAVGEMHMITARKDTRELMVQITAASDKRSILQVVAEKQ